MATRADFRNGFTIELKDDLYKIVYLQHVKPGKGPAFVRTKVKSLSIRKTLEKRCTSGVKGKELTV